MEHNSKEPRKLRKRPTVGNPKNPTTVLVKSILVAIAGFGGGWLVDDYFQQEWPIFTIIFGIMSIFMASFMYQMYKAHEREEETE